MRRRAGRRRAGTDALGAATARPSGSSAGAEGKARGGRGALPRQPWSPGPAQREQQLRRAAATEHAQRWPSRRTHGSFKVKFHFSGS